MTLLQQTCKNVKASGQLLAASRDSVVNKAQRVRVCNILDLGDPKLGLPKVES